MRYRAFISYSHSDEAFARRLHHDLERYRIPARVVQTRGLISNRLGTVFRDRDELASSASLTDTIREALRGVGKLIVRHHIETCVTDGLQTDKKQQHQDELMDLIYTLSK